MNHKMMHNKVQLMKSINRSRLHKIGKQWIVISATVLAALGLTSLAVHTNSYADSVNNNVNQNQNNLTTPKVINVGNHETSSEPTDAQLSDHSYTPSNIHQSPSIQNVHLSQQRNNDGKSDSNQLIVSFNGGSSNTDSVSLKDGGPANSPVFVDYKNVNGQSPVKGLTNFTTSNTNSPAADSYSLINNGTDTYLKFNDNLFSGKQYHNGDQITLNFDTIANPNVNGYVDSAHAYSNTSSVTPGPVKIQYDLPDGKPSVTKWVQPNSNGQPDFNVNLNILHRLMGTDPSEVKYYWTSGVNGNQQPNCYIDSNMYLHGQFGNGQSYYIKFFNPDDYTNNTINRTLTRGIALVHEPYVNSSLQEIEANPNERINTSHNGLRIDKYYLHMNYSQGAPSGDNTYAEGIFSNWSVAHKTFYNQADSDNNDTDPNPADYQKQIVYDGNGNNPLTYESNNPLFIDNYQIPEINGYTGYDQGQFLYGQPQANDVAHFLTQDYLADQVNNNSSFKNADVKFKDDVTNAQLLTSNAFNGASGDFGGGYRNHWYVIGYVNTSHNNSGGNNSNGPIAPGKGTNSNHGGDNKPQVNYGPSARGLVAGNTPQSSSSTNGNNDDEAIKHNGSSSGQGDSGIAAKNNNSNHPNNKPNVPNKNNNHPSNKRPNKPNVPKKNNHPSNKKPNKPNVPNKNNHPNNKLKPKVPNNNNHPNNRKPSVPNKNDNHPNNPQPSNKPTAPKKDDNHQNSNNVPVTPPSNPVLPSNPATPPDNPAPRTPVAPNVPNTPKPNNAVNHPNNQTPRINSVSVPNNSQRRTKPVNNVPSSSKRPVTPKRTVPNNSQRRTVPTIHKAHEAVNLSKYRATQVDHNGKVLHKDTSAAKLPQTGESIAHSPIIAAVFAGVAAIISIFGKLINKRRHD